MQTTRCSTSPSPPASRMAPRVHAADHTASRHPKVINQSNNITSQQSSIFGPSPLLVGFCSFETCGFVSHSLPHSTRHLPALWTVDPALRIVLDSASARSL